MSAPPLPLAPPVLIHEIWDKAGKYAFILSCPGDGLMSARLGHTALS